MSGKSRRGPAAAERERIEALTASMLQSAEMDETAQYLARGRQFAALEEEDLGRRWTAAFKLLFATGAEGALLLSNDLSAELRLRGVALPFDTVSAEMEAVRLRLEDEYPKNPAWREALQTQARSFLDSLKKPRN